MSTVNLYNRATNRITGLVSGLDVDALVKASLTKQQSKIDKAQQSKTSITWKQEAYRSIITKLTEFQNNYLDILNPQSILRKSSMNPITSTVPDDAKKYLTVSGTTDASVSSTKINSIQSIATYQKVQTNSDNKLSSPITLTVSKNNIENIAGKTMSITLDGVTKDITFGNLNSYLDVEDNLDSFNIESFTNDLNEKIKSQFGTFNSESKIGLNVQSDTDPDSNAVTSSVITLVPKEGSGIKVSSSAASHMGIVNNQTSYVNTEQSIGSIFNGKISRTDEFGNVNGTTNMLETNLDDEIKFSINDVEFTFKSSDSLKDIMSKVNASDAGVKMTYSTITDSVTMTATETGSGENIRFSDMDDSNFLSQIFGYNSDGSVGTVTQGTDAVVTINNVELVRSSNNFTVDGINYTLHEATPANHGDIPIETRIDSTLMMDTIKGFVDAYNTLVDEMYSLLTEKVNRDYSPLTDAQREELTEKQIENWESEAKKGILRNDPTLTKMLDSLRTAFSSGVTNANGSRITMASVGISGSSLTSGYSGRLTIDETKLKAAIEADPDAVINLFTQTSDIPKDATVNDSYTAQGLNTNAKIKTARTNQMGVAQRIAEIFTSNINTTYNSEGSLIKIAGTGGKNILIDQNSTLGEKLTALDKSIYNYQQKLYDEEDRLYLKYSQLETALARLNQQGSYFTNTTQV